MGRWRWPVLVALVLVAGCTVRARPEPPPATSRAAPAPTATTTLATTRGTTVAARAFVMDRSWEGTSIRVAPAGPPPVATRKISSWQDTTINTVLVFPLLRAPPSCVRRVELWLRLLRFDDPQGGVIAAYPSEVLTEPFFEARFAPVGGDRDRTPQLRWTATRGC